jgi:multimeric flavodoxin WrbA
MRVVSLLGSPRQKGNSTAMAKRFCGSARELGDEVLEFTLNGLKYRGCQACMACKTKLDRCILEDDLTEVLESVREADVLLLASPIYYGDVSSQLKAFIDRTFSYLAADYTTNPKPSRLSPGKKLVMALAQGNPDQNRFADVFSKYEYFFKWYGFDAAYLIRACGVRDQGDIEGHPDVLRLAEETARKILAKT